MTAAVLETVRSALVPAACPFDFADVNALGERLLRVQGPPQYPNWAGEYAASSNQQANCALCGQSLAGADLEDGLVVAALPDGSKKWAHTLCMMKEIGHRTPVQGWKSKAEHPDCALCGLPWSEHGSYGYESRSCTADPNDDRVYHRAPGLLGVTPIEWYRQAGAA